MYQRQIHLGCRWGQLASELVKLTAPMSALIIVMTPDSQWVLTFILPNLFNFFPCCEKEGQTNFIHQTRVARGEYWPTWIIYFPLFFDYLRLA